MPSCWSKTPLYNKYNQLVTYYWYFSAGLQLTLFIDQEQYVSVLSPAAGIRLLVHRYDQHPFLEEGIDISPGQLASVRVQLVSNW